jgi:predicted transcriptional regulator
MSKIRGMTIACHSCGQPRTEFDGRSLREIRRDAGISLRAMARSLSVSPAYLCDVEHNHRRATPRLVVAYEELETDAARKKGDGK